jgi:outer membrane receptor protein involved in Fe transport
MKKVWRATDACNDLRAAAILALLGAVTLSGARAAAPAGNTPAENNSGLEEIVVTAEKRDSTVQATPISITALSAGDLAQENIMSVQDLVGNVPGLSARTAGPGQTEYEMRGLASAGGSTATVGFYIDETPLSASAVALNGRTVIDADLFDLNHTEVLRGPQGTLYGGGSMGGTIKLVTNPPKLGIFEGATSVDASQTTGGGTNGGGSLMLNFPIGDRVALRVVTTEKYISGWIDRKVIAPGDFPYPTNYGPCGPFYYCTRGNVADAPVATDVKGSNQERFASARAALLVQPMDNLSIITPGQRSDLPALRYPRALLRLLQTREPQGQLRHGFRQSDLGIVVLEARRIPNHRLHRSAAEHLQFPDVHSQSLPGRGSDHPGQRGAAPDVARRREFPMGGRSLRIRSALGLYNDQSEPAVCDGHGLRSGG